MKRAALRVAYAALPTALALLLASRAAAQDAPTPLAPPPPLSLEASTCPAELDADVLAGHVTLEAPVSIVAPAAAALHATWGEPPCTPSHLRVVLRDPAGALLAGPVDLSTDGLSPRLTARIVALWIGEAVRSLPSRAAAGVASPSAAPASAAPPSSAPPSSAAPPSAPPSATVPATPTLDQLPVVIPRALAFAGVGYAPYTTSPLVGGALGIAFALPSARDLTVQLDAGAWPTFTPFGVDLLQLTLGLAVLVPFDLTDALSVSLGVRASFSYVAILAASNGIVPIGDQLLGGGGGLLRATYRGGAVGAFLELEVGAPFASYQVFSGAPEAPPTAITVFDSIRVDGRVGITFE